MSPDDKAARCKGTILMFLAAPLVLILVPFVFCATVVHLSAAGVKGVVRCGSSCCGNRRTKSAVAVAPSSGATPEELPKQAGWWGGDILGYFAYLKGWTKFWLKGTEKSNTTVFQANTGCPALALLDAGSSAAIFAGTNGATVAHGITLRISSALFGGQDVLFTQKGAGAVSARAFLLEILPKNGADDRIAVAVRAMGTELKRWTDMTNQKVAKLKLEAAIEPVISAFATHLFLGRTIDYEIMSCISLPFPTALPAYPYFPAWLLPNYYRARYIKNYIFSQMQLSPNWPAIDTARERAGLTVEQACGILLVPSPTKLEPKNAVVAMRFNAPGMSNSLLMSFAMLPLLPERGRCLLEDDVLLESMAWELLRHNGPAVSRVFEKPVEVQSSDGVKRRIPAGTRCSTHTGMVQRDPHVWKDPHAFKADRFGSEKRPEAVSSLKLRSREGDAEPLPTLCAGYPLGSLEDDEYFTHSHACVFGRIMHPVLKEWVRQLAEDFTFTLKSHGVGVEAPAAADPMAVHLPPDVVRGGADPAFDMIPKYKQGCCDTSMRLSAFEFSSDEVAARYEPAEASQP